MDERLQERRELYNQGLNDSEIGRLQGVDRSAVCYWRKKHGLPARPVPASPTSPMRMLLHNLGWGAQSIARYQGVAVESVKQWRKWHGLPARGQRFSGTMRARERQFESLQKRVVRAVGCRLPYDIAADAAASLMLDVIEGRVPLDQIERQGRAYGNRALQEFANPFTTRSLDAEVPGTDGLREIDRLADDTASAWLERMGATVH